MIYFFYYTCKSKNDQKINKEEKNLLLGKQNHQNTVIDII